MASREVILFIGDDITPANANFFRVHAEMHARYRGRDIGVLGKTVWPNDPAYNISYVMSHIQGRGGAQFGYADLSPYSFIDYRFFYTSNISIKRDVINDWLTEGFSQEFTGAGYEDIEFAYRLTGTLGFRIFYAPAATAIHDHQYDINGFINRQIHAGMMAHVFVRLHPEVAPMIGVEEVGRNLQETPGADDAAVTADYLSVVEGIKSWARLVEAQFKLGSEHWHEDFLHAVFALCYGQGYIFGWKYPRPNLAAAYRGLLLEFTARMQRVIHHEVTGHAMQTRLFAPWMPGNQARAGHVTVPARGGRFRALRSWARQRPLLARIYRKLRGLTR